MAGRGEVGDRQEVVGRSMGLLGERSGPSRFLEGWDAWLDGNPALGESSSLGAIDSGDQLAKGHVILDLDVEDAPVWAFALRSVENGGESGDRDPPGRAVLNPVEKLARRNPDEGRQWSSGALTVPRRREHAEFQGCDLRRTAGGKGRRNKRESPEHGHWSTPGMLLFRHVGVGPTLLTANGSGRPRRRPRTLRRTRPGLEMLQWTSVFLAAVISAFTASARRMAMEHSP